MKKLIVILALFIAACGSGSSTPTKVVVSPAGSDLVVIGNSLAYHAPAPEIGWSGSWGMAASSADKDFAHVAAKTLSLPLTVTNFSSLEMFPVDAVLTIPAVTAGVKSTSVVVVEMGDIVTAPADFAPAYAKLLDAVKHAQTLVCVSTFWIDPPVDQIIKSTCESRGGRYAFIGDIRTDPLSQDYMGFQFEIPAVNSHPHDWGMVQIAARIVAAAGSR